MTARSPSNMVTAPVVAGNLRPTRPPLLATGTVVWLASELMFFSGLFAAYFTMRATARGPWPPEGVELNARVAGLFTAVLVLSSITVQLAVRAIRRGDRAGLQRWMGVTVVLATAFLVNQWHEWDSVTFTIGSHTFGSSFFLMTGFHGLHMLGGIAAMFVILARASSPRFGADDAPAVEVVSYYWHFVDVVWIALYGTLFLLR